jgi:DNA primase
MSEAIDRIKDKISVQELIGEYLKLEKAGTNFKTLCPFHNEKTPSFMVNPERNFWYCFGCQRGGDIFNFLMEIEGIEFKMALQRLAQKAGIELPKYSGRPDGQADGKKTIMEILNQATVFFQHHLGNNPRGQVALDYLQKRKINQEQISQFRVGYAPKSWDAVLNYLVSKGYSISDIEKTGLLVRKNNIQGANFSKQDYYDRFRDRIMFPVFDLSGNPVGFSARIMPDDDSQQGAKYINTPQTVIYDKSNILFGLYQARLEIKKKKFVVVVEGNLDVISSFSAGVENIVAVSGTALTQKHVDIIKRYTSEVKLCFDMDEAGYNATKKSARACLGGDLDVEIISLEQEIKDVNDLVIKDPKLWVEAIEKSRPVLDYFFSAVFSRHDFSSVKGKKLITQELLNIIKDISSPVEQAYWIQKLSSSLQISEEALTKVLEKVRLKTQKYPTDVQEEKQLKKIPKRVALERRLVGLFGLFPLELQSRVAGLGQMVMSDKNIGLISEIASGKAKKDDKQLNEIFLEVKYYYDEKEGFIEREIDPAREWDHLVGELLKELKKEKIEKIIWDIKKAEEQNDEEALALLLEQFSKLSK